MNETHAAATPRFTTRPATDADANFLYRLHEAAMRRYVEQVWGWDDAKQRTYFAAHFDPVPTRIVSRGRADVGTVTVEWREGEAWVGNLEILPEWQGRGVGGAVLRDVIAHADARGLPVALQVLKINPDARRLYERLGFVVTGETATHHLMRRPVALP